MSIYQSQEVPFKPTKEIFYCYLYRDIDGTPIYAGKGKRDRAFGHITNDTHLGRLLRKRLRDGHKIEPEFLCKDVDEEFAFFVEVETIRHYGRKDLGIGTLLNLTDGGEGSSGYVFSIEDRAKVSVAGKGRITSEETKKKLAAQRTGRKCSVETKAKISVLKKGNQNSLGIKRSDESKVKQSIAMKDKLPWNKGISMCEEQKDKISETLKGRKQTTEEKAKQIAAQTGKKQDVMTCPYCPKTGGKGSMKRYHMDNCKMK